MKNLVWIGPRQSDINYTGDLFSNAVTLYGNREQNKASFCLTKDYRINHNHITDEQTQFMVEQEQMLIEQDSDVRFMTYNPNLIFECGKEVTERTLCLNDEEMMTFLDSKISFRKFIERDVHTLHSEILVGKRCNVQFLEKLFGAKSQWIIQSDIASGGYQTFILSAESEKEVQKELEEDKFYLVSPYYEENIPINMHAIIYGDDILLTTGSIQIMTLDCNRLLYRGADFIEYNAINPEVRKQFEDDVLKICKKIQKMGYRGVIGIDAIIVSEKAWILEANNRFQASTILLNRALYESGLPSIHELNLEAFQNKETKLVDKRELHNLKVDYSIYTYLNNSDNYHAEFIYERAKKAKSIVDIIEDGYIVGQQAENDAYLFRTIFNTNICTIEEQQNIRIHPNVVEPQQSWVKEIVELNNYKNLKISLLNQGVVLSEEVKDFLETHGGMRQGVYFSVDLTLENGGIVNSPLKIKFADMSPFHIEMEQTCILYYYKYRVGTIHITKADEKAEKLTSKGIPLKRICLVATDRLRIQNSCFCTFKEKNIPCIFCEAQYKDIEFDVDDILEAVDIYFAEKPLFRHILIGGLSNEIGKEKAGIISIIKHIRKYSDMPIYLMILPPLDIDDINDYVDAGVTEVGFNLECYDRIKAKEYMPGKGNIPLSRYEAAFERAAELLGKTGNVRCAFVVGLENETTLLEGVEFVCKLGVAPIFSVFRPIPYTQMENVIPYSNRRLLEIYNKAEEICKRYDVKVGPSCEYCQNNTLSFDLPKRE